MIGIEHVFTVPYSHEENAIVERANKEVMRHLRALIFDSKTFSNWSDNLPFVQRIMNTAVHESIGISPAQLLLGHSSSFDKGIFIPKEILREKDLPLSEWVSKRMEQQKLLIEKAKETQHEIDTGHLAQRAKKRNLETNTSIELQDSNGAEPKQKQIKKSGIKIIPDNFPIGSFVLVSYPDNSLGKGRPPHKLMMRHKGPFEVISKNKGTYQLKELASNVIAKFNAHLLRPFNHDTVNDNPREVAFHAKQMFDIEKIINHKGSQY